MSEAVASAVPDCAAAAAVRQSPSAAWLHRQQRNAGRGTSRGNCNPPYISAAGNLGKLYRTVADLCAGPVAALLAKLIRVSFSILLSVVVSTARPNV